MVIVAAVNENDRDESVLQEATSLSRAYDEPIHIVYVLPAEDFVDMERESIEQTNQPIDREEIDNYVQSVAEGIGADLDVPVEAAGIVGDAADNLLQYADEHNARYIVIGLRKRSPAGKAIFGSVTQSILLNADRPVVSIVDH